MITANTAAVMTEHHQRARALQPLVDQAIRNAIKTAHLMPAPLTVEYVLPNKDDDLAQAIAAFYAEEGGWHTRVCYGERTDSCWVELRMPDTTPATASPEAA